MRQKLFYAVPTASAATVFSDIRRWTAI